MDFILRATCLPEKMEFVKIHKRIRKCSLDNPISRTLAKLNSERVNARARKCDVCRKLLPSSLKMYTYEEKKKREFQFQMLIAQKWNQNKMKKKQNRNLYSRFYSM